MITILSTIKKKRKGKPLTSRFILIYKLPQFLTILKGRLASTYLPLSRVLGHFAAEF